MIGTNIPRFGTACVLAGGSGRRMEGADKLLVNFAGERLLARIARQLSSRFSDIIAVCQRPEVLAGLGYRIVGDAFASGGPLAGIHAGLLASRSRWVYFVACDMPFFSPAWVDALERRIDEEELRLDEDERHVDEHEARGRPVIAAARSGAFFEPFHAMYGRSFAVDIEAAFESPAGDRRPSIQAIARALPHILLDDAPLRSGEPLLFRNANTIEELRAAEADSIDSSGSGL